MTRGNPDNHNTRKKNDIHCVLTNKRSPDDQSTRVYNQLPVELKTESNNNIFKKKLRKWLLDK